MNWFFWSETAFKYAVGLYLISTSFYLVYLVRRSRRIGQMASGLALAAVALHTVGLAFRWIEGGFAHPPFTNLYESLLFFAWGIAVFYLVLEWRYDFRPGGAFILPVALGAMGAAVLNPASSKDVQNLLPALQSHWLHAHVAVAALAYAAFVAAFGTAVMFLIKDGVDKGWLGVWTNLFLAFLLLISDRFNILFRRVFTLSLIDAEGRDSGLVFPAAAPGRLLLVAVVYFVLAAGFYEAGRRAREQTRRSETSHDSASREPFLARFASLAPLVTFLGGLATLLALGFFFHTVAATPQELAQQLSSADPFLASNISLAGLRLSLFGNPFKLIILALVIFVAAALLLIDLRFSRIQELLPSANLLDSLTYHTISIGFPLMTMVIITGAVWAKKTFGQYWQWDPKETASLICWLIYTIYLHGRVSLNWSSRTLAVISIIGFGSVVFTYLGVNVIAAGYHAYASF